MKKAIFAGAIVAAVMSAPAAADRKSEAYSACKAEVQSVLGDDTRVSLRKIRMDRDVTRVMLRVNQPTAEATTLTCLHSDETLAFQNRDKQPLELAALNAGSSDKAIN